MDSTNSLDDFESSERNNQRISADPNFDDSTSLTEEDKRVNSLFAEWHSTCSRSPQPDSRYDATNFTENGDLVAGSSMKRFLMNDNCCVAMPALDRLVRRGRDTIGFDDSPLLEQHQYFAAIAMSMPKNGVKFVDSHCHIDLLFEKDGHDGCFASYREKRKDTWPQCFEGCITNYCFPGTFSTDTRWENLLNEPGIYGTFGCHPHQVNLYDEKIEEIITDRLRHVKVIAMGEMGLDYSRNNQQDHELQKRVFISQLELAVKYKKPIVIHCRDAEEDCFKIMTEHIPPDHPIHRHCFLESYANAERLINYFSNLKIGLTTFVTKINGGDMMKILSEFPLDRILIETDTPYFLPDYYKSECALRWNHPGLGILVGAKIAEARGVGLVEVLEKIRENTREVYGI